MSALLKSGSAGLRTRVKPFRQPARAVAPPAPDPELERLRAALAEAEARLAARDETIAGFAALRAEAFAEGEAKGRTEVEDGQAARLQVLREAACEALAAYREDMVSLDRLAALLAKTCLDRLLLGDTGRAETVAALLRARLAALDAEAAIRIQVSAEDFPTPEALAAIGGAPCEILASPSLSAGACTIQLRLGTLDIGVDQQWGVLGAALEGLAS